MLKSYIYYSSVEKILLVPFKGEQTWPDNPYFLLLRWVVLVETKQKQKTACKNIQPFSKYNVFSAALMTSLLPKPLEATRISYIFHIKLEIHTNSYQVNLFIISY